MKLKQADELVSKIEAAYYGAYWNGAQKHKKSLESIIKKIYSSVARKPVKRKPIDYKAVDKEFAAQEDLRKYGWFKN